MQLMGGLGSQLKRLIKRNATLHSLTRWIYCKVLYARSQPKWKAAHAKQKPLWLEFGAGPKKGKNGLLAVDAQAACDIPWDLKRAIPLPDGSVDKIYSSHMLEHIPFNSSFR